MAIVMNLFDMQKYKRADEDWFPGLRFAGDGHDQMNWLHANTGFQVLASWGRDGWDLGQWPYIALYLNDEQAGSPAGSQTPDCPFQLLIVTEGDNILYAFPTAEHREQAINGWALWYWAENNESPFRAMGMGAANVVEQRRAYVANWIPEGPDRITGPYRPAEVKL